MTQEEKELLLKDLCARLPYGVKVSRESEKYEKDTITVDMENFSHFLNITDFSIETLRLYLRPMSSMTEEEIKELLNIDTKRGIFSSRHLTWYLDGEVADYLNSHHLDYRGLIEKGLALEAPEGMYKEE